MKDYMKQTVPVWLVLVVLSITGTLALRSFNTLEKQIDRIIDSQEIILKTLALHDKEIEILKLQLIAKYGKSAP